MWVAHLALFRGGGLLAWIGIVIVVQNLASAPFNSHLFDFSQGWLYVFGVGVVGGMVLRERRAAARAAHDRASAAVRAFWSWRCDGLATCCSRRR